MKTFKEFQFGKIIFLFTVPAQIFLGFAFVMQIGNRPMSLASFIMANGVFVILYVLFYGMTTIISKAQIQISYGIGLIRKSVQIANVASVTIVSNPWYYGWGIRLIPNGMLYNINGSSGIELRLKDSKRVIRIGSADAHALTKEIETSMSNTN
jgi:hypothetical protein